MHEKDPSLKALDAPIEVLIFDPVARPLARLLARVPALWLTGVAAVVRAVGATFVAVGALFPGAILTLLGMLVDAIDGKVARLQRRHVATHGYLDFTLDQLLLCTLIACSAYYLSVEGSFNQTLALLAWTLAYFFVISLGGSRFRLLSEASIDWRTPGGTQRHVFSQGPGQGLLRAIYTLAVRLEAPLRKHRIVARPTTIESLFVVTILCVALSFPTWLLWLGTAFLLPECLALLVPSLLLCRDLDQQASAK